MINKAMNSTALSFSDEQIMLQESAQNFCRDQSDIATVRSRLNDEQAYSDDCWKQIVELGWLGVALPESVGGSELGVGSTVPIAEAMGQHLLATPFFSTTLAAQAIARSAADAVAERWLPSIVEGTIATVALLDNDDWGSSKITASAQVDGDKVALQGRKMFVADAQQAQIFVVLVECDGAPAFAIVQRDELAANAIASHTTIDETKRSASVVLDGCTISTSQLVHGSAVESALHDVKLIGALLSAAEACGSAASALNTVVDYLKTRKQFGRLIGSNQALKHPAVAILNDVNHSRSLLYHAATICNDQPLSEDAEIACRMAKAHATDTALYAGDRAVQFHGGMGFTHECDAQLYLRRAQWTLAQFGDPAHHRKRLATLLLD